MTTLLRSDVRWELLRHGLSLAGREEAGVCGVSVSLGSVCPFRLELQLISCLNLPFCFTFNGLGYDDF